MKTYVKNSLSFVVSLISMFLILVASFSFFLDKVILNEKTYIEVLEKEKIYDQVESYINENISYLLASSNIPEDTLEGVISEKEIENIFSNYIYNIVGFMRNTDDQIESLNTSIYEERINNKISNFLRENNMYVGAEFNDNIDEFKGNILNIITSSFQIIDLNALSSSSTAKLIARIASVAIGIEFFAVLVLGILILTACQSIIWKKGRKVRRYAWMGYPFISAGMIIFLIGFSGYLSGFYKNMPIGVLHLKNTMIAIMQKYLLNFTYIGITLIIIGILFMIAYWKHLFRSYSGKGSKSIKRSKTSELED